MTWKRVFAWRKSSWNSVRFIESNLLNFAQIYWKNWMDPLVISTANPQGKGLSTTLNSLHACRPSIPVPPKQIQQVSNEWFTSMFILSSHFQFKPVMGQQYWLYRRGTDEYRLSLIGPKEWHDDRSERLLVGTCYLQADLTWTLQISAQGLQSEVLQAELLQKWQQFEEHLDGTRTLEQALPVYAQDLAYYARVFAAGMACSLRSSMRQANILGCDYQTARKSLVQP